MRPDSGIKNREGVRCRRQCDGQVGPQRINRQFLVRVGPVAERDLGAPDLGLDFGVGRRVGFGGRRRNRSIVSRRHVVQRVAERRRTTADTGRGPHGAKSDNKQHQGSPEVCHFTSA
jgi:hypothetical protein